MTERPLASAILRAEDLQRLRQAEAVLREAEATRESTAAAAASEAQTVLTEARRAALRDSARTAAELIARAEARAEERLTALEPELARLIAQTVRQIVGDFAPEDATHHAALTALRQLRDHRRARIFAAPDMTGPVTRAVEAAGEDRPEIIGFHTDPALEPGRAVMTSDQGSVEIGLAALTDHALRAWETAADADAHPAPAPAAPGDETP